MSNFNMSVTKSGKIFTVGYADDGIISAQSKEEYFGPLDFKMGSELAENFANKILEQVENYRNSKLIKQ